MWFRDDDFARRCSRLKCGEEKTMVDNLQKSLISGVLAGLILVILPHSSYSEEQKEGADSTGNTEEEAFLIVGFNTAQIIWHAAAGAAYDVTWLAFPFEVSVRISDRFAVSGGIHYRYEDYHSGSGIWNNYHEVFTMVGPRLSLPASGLDGWFVSLQVGAGYGGDPSPYKVVTFNIQPEVGYTFIWGAPGFALTLGAGVLFNIPLKETPSVNMNAIGTVAHRVIPLGDIKLGFSL